METGPTRIEANYQAAQAAIDALLNTEAGRPEAGRLEVLSLLAEAWEDERFPVGYPQEIEAVLVDMEQNELDPGPAWLNASTESDA